MATNAVIGNLFIDIQARTAKLEADMAKVRAITAQATTGIKEQSDATAKMRDHTNVMANQLTQRLAGMLAVFTLIKREVMDVWANIEKIPGIPATTVGSILAAKENMSEFKLSIDNMVAAGIARFMDFGRAIGVGAAAMLGYNDMASAHDEETLRRQRQINEEHEKTIKATARLAEMKKDAARADMRGFEQINSLRAEAAKTLDIAGSSRKTPLEKAELELKAFSLTREANIKEQRMDEELIRARERLTEAQYQENEALTSKVEKVEMLKVRIADLTAKLPAMFKPGVTDIETGITPMVPRTLSPEEKEKELKTLRLLEAAQLRYNAAVKANGMLAREMADAIAQGFGQAILSGKKLTDVLRELLGTLLQIILQRTVLGPLADFMTKGFMSFAGLGKAASGGPVNGVTLVGENGPELLRSNYGTVIPNHQLTGGGGSGANFYIDAKGADTAAVGRLEQLLLTLAGPGVVERRSLAATMGARMRQPSFL